MSKEAIQYINATLAAFGPGEAISMTQETWAKLHESMAALAEQPAQRKPLTDEEIDAISAKIFNADFLDVEEIHANRDIARAIEAAHGIKENT